MTRAFLHLGRSLGRAAGLAAALSAAAACQLVAGIEDTTPFQNDGGGPDGSAASEFVVRGVAGGVRAPVALRLQLSDGSELLSVTQDGPFAFQTRLADGVSFSVFLEGQHPCVIDRGAGSIVRADAEIGLACNGAASLIDLVLSGPAAPALTLAPDELRYSVDLPLLQQQVSIRPGAADPDATVSVAGVPVPRGTSSEPMALALGSNEVEIVVSHASGLERTYRLTIRRAAEVAQYVYGKASNTGAGDTFGQSLALSGDTLAVGAPNEDSAATGVNGEQNSESATDSGAVYVFRRTPQGWIQEAYIKASNTGSTDRFGISVALSGDTLAVGAPNEDSGGSNQQDNTVTNAGAVYVFRRVGAGWTQEAYLKASIIRAGDIFGSSVALSGNVLAVGTPRDDGLETDSGAVHVYRRGETGWAHEAYLKASNTGAGDVFGQSVALSGELLAVGAPNEDSAATGVNNDQANDDATDSGAVYVFRDTGQGWLQEAYIKASNTGVRDRFGSSVALSGDTLAVAAPGEDSDATGVNGDQSNDFASDSGAVYVFRRSGTSWAQEAYVKASNTGPFDSFGQSVAISGDTLAVGAFFEDSAATGVNGDQGDDSAPDSGAVYVFQRRSTGWAQVAYVKASNTERSDSFGQAVALSGDTLAVAAPAEDSADVGLGGKEEDNSAESSGAAYIFH